MSSYRPIGRMSWLIIGVGGRACHLELSLDTPLKSQPGLARESASVGVSHPPRSHYLHRWLSLSGSQRLEQEGLLVQLLRAPDFGIVK